MSFLSPLMLYALALALAPVLIHLLNRRRFIRLDWAPMRHLKLTLRNNRRRLRLEQWLLLALRTLVVVLLVMVAARPILSSQAVARLLAPPPRTSRVLLLDDSLSMGYAANGRSAFDAAAAYALELADGLRAQDSLTLLLTSDPQRPVLHNALAADRTRWRPTLEALRPTHAHAAWDRVLHALRTTLQTTTFPNREVVLLTDLRRSGWPQRVEPALSDWPQRDLSLRVVDVGSRRTGNLALIELRPLDDVALPGVNRFEAVIRNDADHPLDAAHATLSINDASRPLALPRLEPGATLRLPLWVSLDQPGQSVLTLRLPDDEMPGDNQRWRVVDVKPQLTAALLDGEPSPHPFQGETDFVLLSLSVGDQPWRVERPTDFEATLPQAQVYVLANVPAIPPSLASQLRQRVEEGAGLLLFVGDQVDVQDWNESLADLLPAMLLEARDDAPPRGLVVDAMDDSPLDALAQLSPATLERIVPRKVFTLRPPVPDARVLARWNEPAGSPAIVERRLGRGRVVLVTLTADRAWSDWPVQPSFVLGLRRAAQKLASTAGSDAQHHVAAGEPFALRQVGLNPQVTPPLATAPLPAFADDLWLAFHATAQAGPYRWTWQLESQQSASRLTIANPSTLESDLTPMSDEEFLARWGDSPPRLDRPDTQTPDTPTPRSEIWRTLALAMLAGMALESLLALYVGRDH